MNKNKLLALGALMALIVAYSSCTKADVYKENAQIGFVSMGPKYVTADITVSPKDSLYFQFNVTSPDNIAKVIIMKGTVNTDTLIVPDASKNSFSGLKKVMADSAAGVYSYTFVAYNAANYKLATKSIAVSVTADYKYITNRVLYVPDTTAKTNMTYFSSTTGGTYNFSGIGTNTAAVDFGYYYDTTTANKHTIYALTANPVSFYDVSTWTKNATVFKKVTNVTIASLSSSGALRTAGIANLTSGTTSKITALASGNVILFKTAAGKYGAIAVNYVSADDPSATTYMKFDVKIQN